MNMTELSGEDERLKVKIERLEGRRCEIAEKIKDRWKFLIGFGCGYFNDWYVDGSTVNVSIERPRGGGPDTDVIPLACFEAATDAEAKLLWQAELERQEAEHRAEARKRDEAELRRLRTRLGLGPGEYTEGVK